MTDSVVVGSAPARFWPQGWWSSSSSASASCRCRSMFCSPPSSSFSFCRWEVASDLPTMIAVLALGGFGCAEIGKRLPVIRNLGAAAIFATFVPSYLVYAHLLPEGLLKPIGEFTKASNFLYLFIAAIIVGSIFGMDRQVLIKGFLKILFRSLPVRSSPAPSARSLAPPRAWRLPHLLFHRDPDHGRRRRRGAIPLSIGYAEILHQEQGVLFAQVLPPIMLGSLTAILLAGFLNWVGKRLPRLSGEGRLQPGVGEELVAGEEKLPPLP